MTQADVGRLEERLDAMRSWVGAMEQRTDTRLNMLDERLNQIRMLLFGNLAALVVGLIAMWFKVQ